MPSHHETEAAFRRALTTQGVPPGITAVGDTARRFSVYRNTVAHTLSEALAQRFPTVRRIVGPEFFAATARVFIAAHPPSSPVLHEYGGDFPAFLADFPPAAPLPFLPDIARLEVLRGRAYHAADADPMPPAQVGDALALDPEGSRLALHASVGVILSGHAIASIWAMNQPGGTPAPPPPEPQAALVFRRAGDVPVLPVPPPVATVIARLRQGATFGSACHDTPPQIAAEAVGTLVTHGLITGLIPTPTGAT